MKAFSSDAGAIQVAPFISTYRVRKSPAQDEATDQRLITVIRQPAQGLCPVAFDVAELGHVSPPPPGFSDQRDQEG